MSSTVIKVVAKMLKSSGYGSKPRIFVVFGSVTGAGFVGSSGAEWLVGGWSWGCLKGCSFRARGVRVREACVRGAAKWPFKIERSDFRNNFFLNKYRCLPPSFNFVCIFDGSGYKMV